MRELPAFSRFTSAAVTAMNGRRIFAITLMVTMLARAAYGQDPSIDRLLKKLPPPEKLVKPLNQNVLAQLEVLGDPLTIQIGTATAYRNSRQALSLSRRLVERHPRNPWVHCIRGSAASTAAQFAEASAAFGEAVRLQPQFAYAHLQLGAIEVVQQHFAAAMPHFKKVVQLDPEAAIGWVFLSGCTEKLGRRQESLDYAKRGIAVAPKAAGTWLQLAHAENALGHTENAKRAVARAQQLMRGQG